MALLAGELFRDCLSLRRSSVSLILASSSSSSRVWSFTSFFLQRVSLDKATRADSNSSWFLLKRPEIAYFCSTDAVSPPMLLSMSKTSWSEAEKLRAIVLIRTISIANRICPSADSSRLRPTIRLPIIINVRHLTRSMLGVAD